MLADLKAYVAREISQNNTLTHGFATFVHVFATKTKALARTKSRQLRRLLVRLVLNLYEIYILYGGFY